MSRAAGGLGGVEELHKVQEAYLVLSDEAKRIVCELRQSKLSKEERETKVKKPKPRQQTVNPNFHA